MPRRDTVVFCCECNAADPEQPLDSVMGRTGFVSSCPGAFCNGNNLVKSKAWSVEPLAAGDDSHLGGRGVLAARDWKS